LLKLPGPRAQELTTPGLITATHVCWTSRLSSTNNDGYRPCTTTQLAWYFHFVNRRYDHVSDALAILHWRRLPEHVNFKLALMAYRVLNGMTPPYLNQQFLYQACQVVAVCGDCGRRSRCSCISRRTAGCRSFSVAVSIFWNTLPDDMQSAPSVSSFRRQLKTFLLQSFPDIMV